MKKPNHKTMLLCVTTVALFTFSQNAFAQAWTQGGNGTIVDDRLGTGSGTNSNLRFITNGVENMRIDYTTGAVGIGNGHVPNHYLDVDLGDININTITKGYRIGGSGSTASNFVLWHNGRITNIFVGVGAGINASNTGVYNTFAGNNAGFSNTSANWKFFHPVTFIYKS